MDKDKTAKSIGSGVAIFLSIVVLWYVWKLIWFLAFFLFPVIVIVGVLYFLGNLAPKETHDKVEAEIRKGLDWMDFNAPSYTWPMIRWARTALDWLGLQVKKA